MENHGKSIYKWMICDTSILGNLYLTVTFPESYGPDDSESWGPLNQPFREVSTGSLAEKKYGSFVGIPVVQVAQRVTGFHDSLWIQTLSEKVLNPPNYTPNTS